MTITDDELDAHGDQSLVFVLVCGGRAFGDLATIHRGMPRWDEREAEYKFIHRALYEQLGKYLNEPEQVPAGFLTIINGGADGVDSASTDWAVVNWIPFIEYKADWGKHGPAAGPIRNQQMLDEGTPDLVIAFPGGKGTADMVRRARKANIEVKEIVYEMPKV